MVKWLGVFYYICYEKIEQDLLDEFAKYLLELQEVCVVTEKELNDPNWKPPFEAGLIVHHMVYHGDENSPHIHMTYVSHNVLFCQSESVAFTENRSDNFIIKTKGRYATWDILIQFMEYLTR